MMTIGSPRSSRSAPIHRDEGLAVLLADVVDSANIRVVQRRRSLRFALETSECLRILSDLFREELERDETMETSVFSLVDDAHSAAA